MSNEEPWMSEEVSLVLESADVDLLELLADTTAYPDVMAWVEPMLESLKGEEQLAHRLDGFFERVFNACIKAVKEDK
jgi:hypothetical protein